MFSAVSLCTMLDFQARHTTSWYQINNSRYHKHSFSKAISLAKITKTGKRLSIFLGKNNVCSRWGKWSMSDLPLLKMTETVKWGSKWDGEKNQQKRLIFCKRRKIKLKQISRLLYAAFPKKGGKDNSIYIFPCFIEQKIILYETIEYAMRVYAQSWDPKDKEQWNKKK